MLACIRAVVRIRAADFVIGEIVNKSFKDGYVGRDRVGVVITAVLGTPLLGSSGYPTVSGFPFDLLLAL